jgi:hypothetical protein
MICPKCKSDNPFDKKFCGDCGTEMPAPPEPVAVEGEEGAWYCFRHKKEVTRVRCGRCETPICPRCMVFSPAGVRCKDCAKNRVPLRWRGVLHSAGQNGGQVVWYAAVWAFIISIFTGGFGNRDG